MRLITSFYITSIEFVSLRIIRSNTRQNELEIWVVVILVGGYHLFHTKLNLCNYLETMKINDDLSTKIKLVEMRLFEQNKFFIYKEEYIELIGKGFSVKPKKEDHLIYKKTNTVLHENYTLVYNNNIFHIDNLICVNEL